MEEVLLIVPSVLALVTTVLAFIFIAPEKMGRVRNGFVRFLHATVNFKYLFIEKIMQALYIFSTCSVILTGFLMLFIVVDGYYSSTWLGGYGFLLMLLGPIVIRIIYELFFLMLLLVKHVAQINKKLAPAKTEDAEKDEFSFEKKPPVQPSYCTSCGEKMGVGDFCPRCGARKEKD